MFDKNLLSIVLLITIPFFARDLPVPVENAVPNSVESCASRWADQYLVGRDGHGFLCDSYRIKMILEFLALSHDLAVVNMQILKFTLDLLAAGSHLFEGGPREYVQFIKDKAKLLNQLLAKEAAMRKTYDAIELVFKKDDNQGFRAAVEALSKGLLEASDQALMSRKDELDAILVQTRDDLASVMHDFNRVLGRYQSLIDGKPTIEPIRGLELSLKIYEGLDVGKSIGMVTCAILKRNSQIFDLQHAIFAENKRAALAFYRAIHNVMMARNIQDCENFFSPCLLSAD